MGLKEEILALDDRKVVEVEVPEWGGRKVRIMEMSAADRDAWELGAFQATKGGQVVPRNVRASLVARCLVDEKGERPFDDDAIDALGGKSAKALDRLYDAARKVNALTEAEVGEVGKN